MSVNRNRRLYIDGNTVYGIDEECMKKKQRLKERGTEGKKEEEYLALLMSLFYFQKDEKK